MSRPLRLPRQKSKSLNEPSQIIVEASLLRLMNSNSDWVLKIKASVHRELARIQESAISVFSISLELLNELFMSTGLNDGLRRLIEDANFNTPRGEREDGGRCEAEWLDQERTIGGKYSRDRIQCFLQAAGLSGLKFARCR